LNKLFLDELTSSEELINVYRILIN